MMKNKSQVVKLVGDMSSFIQKMKSDTTVYKLEQHFDFSACEELLNVFE